MVITHRGQLGSHPVISLTKQGVRVVADIGFGGSSVFFDIIHKTGGTISHGPWVSASCDNAHATGAMICYGPWAFDIVYGLRLVTGIGSCVF